MGIQIEVGPNNMDPDGFKVMMDGQDITDQLSVKRVSFDLVPGELTTVELELYVDKITIQPTSAKLNQQPKP